MLKSPVSRATRRDEHLLIDEQLRVKDVQTKGKDKQLDQQITIDLRAMNDQWYLKL